MKVCLYSRGSFAKKVGRLWADGYATATAIAVAIESVTRPLQLFTMKVPVQAQLLRFAFQASVLLSKISIDAYVPLYRTGIPGV